MIKIFGFEGPKRERSEGEKEAILFKAIRKAFSSSSLEQVNMLTIRDAFDAAREINERENLGFTNNRLLNAVKNTALGMAGTIEDMAYGGRDQTEKYILQEIESLREGLTDEEKRT